MTIDPDYPFGDEPDMLGPFVDRDAQQLVIADRSTLEVYAACPAQGVIRDSGKIHTANNLTNSGQEVHDAFSGAITDYIEQENFAIPMAEYVDGVLARLRTSRPDVQPDVLEAAERSAWEFCKLVMNLNPDNVLKYDGGKDARNGQLAMKMPECGIIATSELDFLHSGPVKSVLHLVDWKSGWKFHDGASVWNSFQFQLHWALIAENFPKVEAVSVRVFNTRRSTFSRPVEFERRDLKNITARIHTAADAFMRNRLLPIADAAVWPSAEKCRICDARKFCPMPQPAAVADDPVEAVRAYIAAAAKAEALKEELTEYVDSIGQDIVTPDGDAFGRDKPASDRKTPAAIYTTSFGQREAKAGKKAKKVTTTTKETEKTDAS